MNSLDIRKIIGAIKETVESHKIDDNENYCRWLWQNPKNSRRLGVNEYGCADAMNILYTIGEFSCTEEVRQKRIRALQALQDPKTGLFNEETHHPIHTTAHCVAAIELFDAKPLYPLSALHKYLDKAELYKLLDNLDWNDPWPQSHQGAGVYAALINAGEASLEWENDYFAWFVDNAEDINGFWKKGFSDVAEYSTERWVNGRSSIYPYMAGGFHYLFNHEYRKQPIPYPEKMVDCCIKMYTENGLPDNFCKSINFIEIDWIFCLNRAMRQTTHRFDEGKAIIWDFAKKYVDFLNSLDYKNHDLFNDLHSLFGCVCALAELQTALPGKIITEKALRLVLDRRPFI